MLRECAFDDVPSWLLNELLQSCPNFKWSRNGLPLEKDTPKLTIKRGSERIKVDPENHDDQRYWELKIYFVHAGVSTSTIEINTIGVDSWNGLPRYHDVYELQEPENVAFYATLSLVGPRNMQDNSPTNYKTARLVLGSPVYVSDRLERRWEDIGATDTFDVNLTLRLYQNSISDLPYIVEQPLGQNFDPVGLVPPPWFSFELWNEFESELVGLTKYKVTQTYYDYNGSPSTSQYEYESTPWTSSDFIDTYNSLLEGFARDGNTGNLRYYHEWMEFEFGEEIMSLAENATVKADIALIRKLSSGPVNLGMMAAGMSDSARMLYGRVSQLVQVLDALRSRDVRTLTKLLGQPQRRSKRKDARSLRPEDLFLEYQFGWVQLYNDLNGILQVLLEEMYQSGQILHANAYAPSDPDINQYRVFTRKKNTPDPDFLIKEADKNINILRGNQAPVRAVIDDDDYRDSYEITVKPLSTFPMFATQHNSNWKVQDKNLKTLQVLGITNPFVVAWDLVSYSFVVDWIISTDAIVKQISYDDGLVRLPSSTTLFEYWPKTVTRSTSRDIWDGDIELVQAPCSLLVTGRTPREFNLSVDLAQAIRQAASPFDIYQIKTLTALLMQRIKR